METASRVVTEDARNVFPFGLVFDDQMFGLSIVASGHLDRLMIFHLAPTGGQQCRGLEERNSTAQEAGS